MDMHRSYSDNDRLRSMSRILLASAAAMLFFACYHTLVGCCQSLSVMLVLLSGAVLLLLWLQSRGVASARIEDGLACCALILFTVLLTTETLENTGPFWVAGYPFVLYFIKPVRYARYWVGAFLLVMVACMVLELTGYISLTLNVTQLACLIAIVAFFWMLAHIYQSLLEMRQSQLEVSNRTLDRQQRQLQAILDHAPNGIWMIDTNRHIQFLNQTWVKWSNLSEQAAQEADDYSVLLPPDVAAISLANDAKCLAGESPLYSRQSFECGDGVRRTFDIIRVRINNKRGEARGLVGFAIDISDRLKADRERKELERQVQHSQRLESLGVMAGGVAHDFNNLLMAIIGNTELARFDTSLNDETREFLEHIDMASQAAADLCQQLLAYSGKGMLEASTLDIRQLIDDMSQLLQTSVGKQVSLEVHHASDLMPVYADKGQIRQVILNILMNAAESIPEGESGRIDVYTRAEQLQQPLAMEYTDDGCLPAGDYVVLEIADNGCGMSGETLDRIFDPFFSTKFTGRGLGMSAVLGIIRAHHGGLQILTNENEGTVMRIWLPASDKPQYVGKFAQHISGPADKELCAAGVLVVDDEESVLRVASRMLERLGCTVLTAGNGREALDVFTRHADQIDWVLLDMTMPVMDGMACLKELRLLRPGVLVAMSTGYNQESLNTATESPDAFLKKPYTFAEMKALVQRLCPEKDKLV